MYIGSMAVLFSNFSHCHSKSHFGQCGIILSMLKSVQTLNQSRYPTSQGYFEGNMEEERAMHTTLSYLEERWGIKTMSIFCPPFCPCQMILAASLKINFPA